MRSVVVVATVLLLVVSLAQAVFAGTDIGFYGFGARAGIVMPEDPIESTFGLGIHSDLGTISDNLHLGAVIEYWGKSYEAAAGLSNLADWSWSEILIAGTVKYMFPTQSAIRPYLGGEMGFAIGRWDWKYSYASVNYDESGSDTKIAFGALGGVEVPLSSSMKGIAEVKYHINGIDYLGIFGGITFVLGR